MVFVNDSISVCLSVRFNVFALVVASVAAFEATTASAAMYALVTTTSAAANSARISGHFLR